MKYTIQAVTRLQDNGDGGYTMYVYNNEEELLNDHPLTREWKMVKGKWQDVKIELTEEQKDDILNEDNPYDNGYIGHQTIEIEIIDGVAKLCKGLSFHAGQ